MRAPALCQCAGTAFRQPVSKRTGRFASVCQYHRPARYDDELEVKTEGRVLSPVRMEFTYEVRRIEDGDVAAAGRTVHAALDVNGRPCRLPARVHEVFA